MNFIKSLFGYKKEYSDEELNEIAGKGLHPIIAKVPGTNDSAPLEMYTWQSIYDAYIEAGLDEETAKEETNKRVLRLD